MILTNFPRFLCLTGQGNSAVEDVSLLYFKVMMRGSIDDKQRFLKTKFIGLFHTLTYFCVGSKQP